MADLPNRLDLFDVARRYVRLAPNTRINPDLVDVPGSDINLVCGVGSTIGENLSAAFARCVRGQFFDTARKDQLDRLAADRLGMTRLPETPASVDLALTRPSFAAGAGTVSAGLRVQTADGTQFSLDVDVVFGATDLGPKAVAATAVIAGPTGNVPALAIASFLDSPFDPTIVPTNAAPGAGGALAESDAQFKGRIRGFFAAIRRGVLGAITFGATQVPGVVIATAFEIVNPGTGLPAGAVQLVVGDANGNATTDMLQAVQDIMIQYRAAGIPVYITAGVVVPEPVSWRLSYLTGVNTVQAQEDVRAVTVAISQFLAPGSPLYRGSLIAAAKTVPGVIISSDSLVAPAGDVFPVDNTHIIRVLATDVTFL